MAQLDYALCPACEKEATTQRDVRTLFGFRRFEGKTYVQSHCKDCRRREQKLRRRAGIETKRH